MLLPIYKEHNLSSIHNNGLPYLLLGNVVTNIQRTQFKFNSQQSEKSADLLTVVTNIQRTQFKFNSQRFSRLLCATLGCYQYTKNTI